MRKSVPKSSEHTLRGSAIGLPLVETLGAIRSHSASRISWHRHRRFELLFLLEGVTSYEFASGRTIDLSGGHLLIVPPGEEHRGLHDIRQPASLCGIVFHPTHPRAVERTPFTVRELAQLARGFHEAALTARRMGPELVRLVERLSASLRAAEPAGRAGDLWPAELRTLVCAILLQTAAELAQPARPGAQAVAAAVVAHLQEHLAEPLALGELTRQTGYSRARLFQLFKSAKGTTPNDFLVRLRVTRAQELLAQPGQTVTEIAQACGFSTSQYFSKVFRRYAGCTPSVFRARRILNRHAA